MMIKGPVVVSCAAYLLTGGGSAAAAESLQRTTPVGELSIADSLNTARRIGSVAQASQAACGRGRVVFQRLRVVNGEPYDQVRLNLQLCRGSVPMVLANLAIRNEQAPGVSYQFISQKNHNLGVSLFIGEKGTRASFFYLGKDVTQDSGRDVAFAGRVVAASGRVVDTGYVASIRPSSFRFQGLDFWRNDNSSLRETVTRFGLGVVTLDSGRRELTSVWGG